jgi:hypothetical protein
MATKEIKRTGDDDISWPPISAEAIEGGSHQGQFRNYHAKLTQTNGLAGLKSGGDNSQV